MTQNKRSAILIRTGAVLSSFLFTVAVGNASIIPVLSGTPSGPSGGPYTYNYTANLQQDESLDPAATDGVTCPGLGGLVQCDPAGHVLHAVRHQWLRIRERRSALRLVCNRAGCWRDAFHCHR